jgi:E3 SUMO-protein ligase NSE2
MLGSQRRVGRGTANHRQRQEAQHDHQNSLDLPPYEPPKCPLAGDYVRKLGGFCTGRVNDTYEKQLASSTKLLSQSVYGINERVTNRRKLAAQNAARAAKRKHGANGGEGDDEAAAAERAENAVRQLEEETLEIATQIEEAMREALDMQAHLEDDKTVLRSLPELVAARQREVVEQAQREREADGEEADPPDVPGVPVLDVLREACEVKAAEYDRLTAYDKYARNNEYITLRQSWHEGLYQNPDDIPLPDATKWFDRDGRPRLETRRDEQNGEADEDGDQDGDEDDGEDEIQIAREKRSLRCPLSLAVIREPFTCRQCKHSFEKSAITEYIKGGNGRGRVAKCPVPGCKVEVSPTCRYTTLCSLGVN